MSTDFDWDAFEQPTEFPDRFKFEQPGQQIVGTITNVRITDFGGTAAKTPELWISRDDGTEVSVAASQAYLRSALADQKPQVGDRIAIVYTGDGQAKPGKSAPKMFDVKVAKGNGATTPSASTADVQPASTQAVDSAPVQPAQQPVSVGAGPSAADLL